MKRGEKELLQSEVFEQHVDTLMRNQRRAAVGARVERLADKHYGYAERLFLANIWWPAFGHFEHLQLEYEIKDFYDKTRFLDFAFIRGGTKVCIEVDGYGPHWKDIGRAEFSKQLMRQNHLVLGGWQVLRFSYDDVKDKPRQCQQILHQLLGASSNKVRGGNGDEMLLRPLDREVLRLLLSTKEQAIKASHVAVELGVSILLARASLVRLASLKLLAPSNENRVRVHSYVVHPQTDITNLFHYVT